jgi:hypothetical protein
MGPIFAGLMIAAGAAQIKAIKNAQFGGGTAPSVAGKTPATPVTPVDNRSGGGAASGTEQTLILQGLRPGELVSSDAVIAAFNQAAKNGARIVIPSNAQYV